ncbi:MAG: MucB/RseB C-terminal domain-containing protein [Pseudomonadales bacterium]|nr:MucB/RseB C-terminal domain-containing protein [Pseudomonadales bacterium]
MSVRVFAVGDDSSGNDSSENKSEIAPQDLLKRMNSAFNTLNYEGRFFYLSGNNARSVRIVHGVIDGVEKERLVHLDGPFSEVIRNGSNVVCMHEGETVDRFEQSFSGRSYSQRFASEKLLQFYEVRLGGDDRVAGRSAQRLQLKPKDNNRFGYILWLDKESGLLLKSVLFNQDGKPLEVFQFTQLEVGVTIDPAEFVSAIDNTPVSSGSNSPQQSSDNWKVNWLPTGYELSANDIRRIVDGGNTTRTLMYTDGLSAFTLFMDRAFISESLPPVTRKGATVAISRKIAGNKTPYLVTIVGELPNVAAQQILNSVQWVDGSK